LITLWIRRSEAQNVPADDSLRIPRLIALLTLLPVFLFGYAVYCSHQSTSMTRDVVQADSFRSRSIVAYQAAREGDTATLTRERRVMSVIRQSLTLRYPALVAETTSAWKPFVQPPKRRPSRYRPAPLIDPYTTMMIINAEAMQLAADRLATGIEDRQRALAEKAGDIAVLALISLVAILPFSFGLIFQMQRAQIILLKSESRLAEAQEAAGIGSWELDIASGRNSWSREVYRLLEFDIEKGTPDYDTLLRRYHPSDVPLHRRIVTQAAEDGQPFSFDVRAILNDGSIRWLHASGSGARSNDGKVARLVGTMQDITERKALEERLRVSEERVNLAMDAAEDVLWDWVVPSGKLTVNRQWHLMLGYAESQFTHNISYWQSLFPPDEWAEAQRRIQLMMDGSATAYEYEHRLRHKNGEWIWVLGRGKVASRDAKGETIRVIGTMVEITDRKRQEDALTESQERFRLAINAMQDGLMVINQKGQIEICNRRAEDILGLTARQMADRMLGRTSFDPRLRAMHADGTEWPGETHPTTLALRDGITSRDTLMGIHKTGGVVTWLSVNTDPLFRTGETRAHAVVVTFTDITLRRQMEEQQAQLMNEAIERGERDPLTDLYNHRTFHLRLRDEAERVQAEGETMAVIVLDMDNFKFFNDSYGHLVGDQVLCTVANALRETCRGNDVLARIGGDEFAILLPRAERDNALICAERLRKKVQTLSFRAPGEESSVPLRLSVGIAVIPDETCSYAEAVEMADKRAMEDKEGGVLQNPSEDLRASLHDTEGFAMLDALVVAVDNKDRYTRRHSEDVMVLSGLIAREMGLSADAIRSIEVAALVHDVGKIAVPIRLLRQPSALSNEDFETVRQHPTLGGILVGAFPELAHTLGAVRHHHERWDGRGYPDGLAGEATPLDGRIMAVADAFSAMTTDRPYRVAMPTERALDIVEENMGTQFDPVCAAAFLKIYRGLSPEEREKIRHRRDPASTRTEPSAEIPTHDHAELVPA